jgi:signal transduction histidine kinase
VWSPTDTIGKFHAKLPRVRIPVRFKITLPYLFLALVMALIGAYIVSRLVLETIEDRFVNQLIEAGKLSFDRMVIEERDRLQTLRLLSNTVGMAESVSRRDPDRIRQIALPVAVNNAEEAIEVLDPRGRGVLSIRRKADSLTEYDFTTGDIFSTWTFVRRVGETDDRGDKYAGIVRERWGDFFYVAGPILDNEGNTVGAMMVGKSLLNLARQFRQDTLAQTSFYNQRGELVASSLLTQLEKPTDVPDAQRIELERGGQTYMRVLTLGSVNYREVLGRWVARDGEPLGLIGAALPETFLVRPSQATQVLLFSFLAAGLLLIISAGVYIARRITQPLLQVVDASARASQGDFNVSVRPEGNDEVAVLAHAFNTMIGGLREAAQRQLREIELMRALEHERELRALKTRFVSMVSHEFRTPLATILSSTEYIKNFGGQVSPEKRDKHFDRIQGSVTNMTRLLEEVLLVGRTESGRLDFKPQPMDIDVFCREVVDEMQAVTSAHGLRYLREGDFVNVTVDEKLMRLILTNLLANAIKYSPNGGEVLILLACEPQFFTLSIKDNGVGIPDADQPRLFEAFRRASNTGKIAGTGLGLYITKMAVELHGGNITFTSTEGSGTTFIVRLPAMPPDAT